MQVQKCLVQVHVHCCPICTIHTCANILGHRTWMQILLHMCTAVCNNGAHQQRHQHASIVAAQSAAIVCTKKGTNMHQLLHSSSCTMQLLHNNSVHQHAPIVAQQSAIIVRTNKSTSMHQCTSNKVFPVFATLVPT